MEGKDKKEEYEEYVGSIASAIKAKRSKGWGSVDKVLFMHQGSIHPTNQQQRGGSKEFVHLSSYPFSLLTLPKGDHLPNTFQIF